MESRYPRIAKTLLKNKMKGLILLNIKSCYKGMVIKIGVTSQEQTNRSMELKRAKK